MGSSFGLSWRTSVRMALAGAVALAIFGGQAMGAEAEATAAAAKAEEAAAPLSLDYSGDLWNRPALTGDWGGVRNEMERKGITVDMTWTQTTQGVVNGGISTGWKYGGSGMVNLNMDTGKMGLWPGGFFNLIGEGSYGEFITRDTGVLLPANANALFPMPNATGGFDLSSVQYTQFFSEHIGVFLGKINTIMDGDSNAFAHGTGNELFLNTAFCFNPTIAVTVPYSTLGAGFIVLPTGKPDECILTFAALDAEGEADTSGFNTVFKGGTVFTGQGRIKTDFFGMTGHQLIGGTYSDRLFTDLDQPLRNIIIPGLPTEQSSGSWSGYYNFDQYVYQPDKKSDVGVGLFGRFGVSDGQANPIHFFYSIGVGGKGLIPGRKLDRFGVGYYYIVASEGKTPERLNFGDSQGLEAFYEIAITPWLLLTPDIQVLQPSQERVDTVTVLGLRLLMKF